MDLALFDLDNTLLNGDSDYEWGRYMCELGAVNREHYEETNRKFYRDYCAGTFDIDAYLRFALKPLADHGMEQLLAWRRSFIDRKVRPMITPAAQQLVESHREKGDLLVVISSTNRFLVEPIAALFATEHVIATEIELKDGAFSGHAAGIPCYGEGKLRRLRQWLKERRPDYRHSWFYSDSINDLPTLKWADQPVVVNGDEQLLKQAARRKWRTISLSG